MRKLVSIAIFVLALLLFSQGVWLSEFIQKEELAYRSSLEKELQQMIDFHATESFGVQNYGKTNEKSFIIEEDNSTEETDKQSLAVLHLNTNNYKQDKASFSKLVHKVFTEQALATNEFRLQRVDSLFQENFSKIEQIASYKMSLLNKQNCIDSTFYKKWSNENTLSIKIPLGTENNYFFEGSFQIKKSAFVQNLLVSIGISAFAIILVAFFIAWQLIALKRSQQKLEYKQKVVAGIVHDLKSPLAHTYTILDFFSQTEQDTFKQEQLSVAGNRVKTLSERIAYILSVFKTQESNILLEPKPYVLFEKCSLLIEELSKTYQNKTLDIKLIIPKNFKINVDEFYFDIVLRNLLENAIKYSEEKVFLSIFTEITNKKLYLHIADRGKGIADKEQKKIFREYYRVKNATAKGHGIGLSFTKMIVKKHRGNITLDSKLGEGSTFTLSFPKTILL